MAAPEAEKAAAIAMGEPARCPALSAAFRLGPARLAGGGCPRGVPAPRAGRSLHWKLQAALPRQRGAALACAPGRVAAASAPEPARRLRAGHRRGGSGGGGDSQAEQRLRLHVPESLKEHAFELAPTLVWKARSGLCARGSLRARMESPPSTGREHAIDRRCAMGHADERCTWCDRRDSRANATSRTATASLLALQLRPPRGLSVEVALSFL